MKAEEVLKRYAAGERNFRNAALQRQNFQGKDLSNADFSYADIRGTNFTNANLSCTNFTGVIAGLSPPYLFGFSLIVFIGMWLFSYITSTCSSLLFSFLSLILPSVATGFPIPNSMHQDANSLSKISSICNIIAFVFSTATPIGIIIFLSRNGLRIVISIFPFITAILGGGAIATAFGTSTTIVKFNQVVLSHNEEFQRLQKIDTTVPKAVVEQAIMDINRRMAEQINSNITIPITVAVIGIAILIFVTFILGIIAGIIAISTCYVIISILFDKRVSSILFGLALIVLGLTIALINRPDDLQIPLSSVNWISNNNFIFQQRLSNFIQSCLWILIGFTLGRKAFSEDNKFDLLRVLGISFCTIEGTRFVNANLTNANFTRATLKSTGFNQATLTHVCWDSTQQLDKARVGDSILADRSVRELLVSRYGYRKLYLDADLKGANLQGVNLEGANLTRANLSGALLQNANLKDANLREVLATGANFDGVHLTGACLESWNIDHTTKLNNVDCQYVFLLEHLDKRGNRERRPHDPDRIFAPGDFEKLYNRMMNLVQILLKNGVNREAFAEAFQNLMDENPDIDYTSIQAIERKGEDVLLTLEVPENADKAKIEQSFLEPYEIRVKQLEAENAQLRLRSTELRDIALKLAVKQPTQITNVVGEGKVTNETTNHSQTVHIGGNVTGSTINLGEISGSVSNVVNQLPSSPDPDQPGLKDLLTQLQAAIETADELSPEDKADALEQVKVLAELGQNPQTSNKESIWRKAWKILNAPIPGLPETATIVKSFAEILPAIAKILGVL